jgi:N utilization substance protein B
MKRRMAREIAVQSLYHMELNEVPVRQAIGMAMAEAGGQEDGEAKPMLEEPLSSYVLELVTGTGAHQEEIDRLLAKYLKGWQLSRLSKVDRQILRLACYEMVYREDVPPRAAINEAIELAKHFGTEESGKFVNGVLGQMIKQLDEIKSSVNGSKIKE